MVPITGCVVLTVGVGTIEPTIDCDNVVLDLVFNTLWDQSVSCLFPFRVLMTHKAMRYDGVKRKIYDSFWVCCCVLRRTVRATGSVS